MNATDNKTRFGAFGFSLILHGSILLALATLTVHLTTPEGNVTDGSVQISVVPRGSQLETQNVEPTAKPEAPQKLRAHKTPPPAKVAKPKSTPKNKIVPVPDGELPVKEQVEEKHEEIPEQAVEEPAKPEEKEEAKEPEVTPVPVVQEDKVAEPVEQPAPEAKPVEKPSTAQGGDQINSKAQEKTVDQTYGAAEGVAEDKTLTAVPGNKKPDYPFMARFRRIEGTVVVQFAVAQDGSVSNVQLVKSDNKMFNQPSLDAVKTWRFRTPVEAKEYFHQFNFQLRGEAREAPTRVRRGN